MTKIPYLGIWVQYYVRTRCAFPHSPNYTNFCSFLLYYCGENGLFQCSSRDDRVAHNVAETCSKHDSSPFFFFLLSGEAPEGGREREGRTRGGSVGGFEGSGERAVRRREGGWVRVRFDEVCLLGRKFFLWNEWARFLEERAREQVSVCQV